MTNVVVSHSQEQYPDDKNHKELVMKILVSLRFGNGDFQRGFEKIALSAGMVDSQNSTELEIKLPSAPLIPELYQYWQDKYSELVGTSGRKVILNEPVTTSFNSVNIVRGFSQSQPTNLSYDECQKECNQYALDLRIQINQWLAVIKSQLDAGFELDTNSDILLTINTENITSQVTKDILHKLPWQEWDYFHSNSAFEAVLCLSESDSNSPSVASVADDGIFRRVRITSIFGDSTNIDVNGDRQLIAKLQKRGAELINLEQPQRQDFIKLWDEPCDILFYSGHSETCMKGTVGSLQINSTDSLNLQEIRNTFSEAIRKGLKLAIFNSCDGLGLAKQLADLHLPYIIVWREPVPDQIAQRFLEYFLSSYADGKSLFNSVRDARIKLVELTNSAEKEKQIPGLEWLPIICKNTTYAPPTWEDLGGLTGKLPDCPYQGLSAFGEEDKDFFFGRDDVITDLLGSVNSKPLVPVIGASGSGKSSVVFAGLVPHLRDVGNVQIVSFRPGKNPFDALGIALNRIKNIETSNSRLKELDLVVNLEHDEKGLCKLIEDLKTLNSHRFVIIADQFEELYTLTEESHRQSFLDLLLYTVQNAPSFSLVLTLRADFLGKALDYQPMGAAFKKYPPILLTPMKREELQAAIEQPAAKMKVELEQGLTSKLIDDLGNQPGRLPLLEFTLSLLWDKHDKWYLTHKAYEEIGGLEKALAKYAGGVLNPLSAVDKERAERIFIQLVSPGEGTEDTKRKATRGEVGEDNWDLVEFLANHRLVVTGWDESSQQETVEIVHEALIREWGMLREWIDENRDKLRQKHKIETIAEEWRDKGKSKDYLLMGKQLANAKAFQQEEAESLTLSNLGCELIEKSIKQKQNNRFKLIGFVFIPFVFLAIFLGFIGEREARIRRHWETIKAEKSEKVSPVRIQALEELAKLGVNLSRINLSSTKLIGADLIHTNLSYANFSSADLSQANLFGAQLEDANFSGAQLEDAKFSVAKLNSAKFTSANLSDADLSGADLSRANLSDAVLDSTNLRGAKLGNADLSNTNLTDADLSGADLSSANLKGANLSDANLSDAYLKGTNLSDVVLDSANLENSLYDKQTLFPKNFNSVNRKMYLIAPEADLKGAYLKGKNLSNTDLSAADLRGANLSNADLSGVDLRGAQLESADLSAAQLEYADLRGAQLEYANLNAANVRREKSVNYVNLNGANLGSAQLKFAYLRGAQLKSADLINADLSDANLRGADLINADLSDANLRGADLINADLSDANLSSTQLEYADLNGTKFWDKKFGEAKNITPRQIKKAKNWEKATYSPRLRKKLGLP